MVSTSRTCPPQSFVFDVAASYVVWAFPPLALRPFPKREREKAGEGRKVENEWKAVVPGMDSAQPIQAWLNELTTELGEHYEDPTMLALIDKNKILFLLGQLD